MSTVAEYAKAVVAAVLAAVITALAGLDWYEIVASAIVSGGGVARTPNKKKKYRR